jgi:hypothetical protein
MRWIQVEDELLAIPNGWDVFVFRGWVYQVLSDDECARVRRA